MFKLLRKIIICVVVLIVAFVGYHFLGNPVYQRGIAQKAEELREELKEDKKKPVWTGTAVVVDALEGDRLKVNTEAGPGVIVRLAGVDAPEMPEKHKHQGQPLAEESRGYLSELVKDKAVEMSIIGTDAAKRPLVLLTLEGALINVKMVEAGLAEAAEEGLESVPVKTRHALQNAELAARQQHLQIWSLTNYVRPVEFRIRQQKTPGAALPR